MWFSTTITYSSSYSSQKDCVSKNLFLFQNLLLWAIPSHLIMIQNQQEFKIQTNKVP